MCVMWDKHVECIPALKGAGGSVYTVITVLNGAGTIIIIINNTQIAAIALPSSNTHHYYYYYNYNY